MSAAEAWPTEAAATKAVEAVARKAFEDSLAVTAEATKIPLERYAGWDDAGPVVQHQWRDRVLPLVWATIEALPDPRRASWTEGLSYGQQHPASTTAYLDNPYPEPV